MDMFKFNAVISFTTEYTLISALIRVFLLLDDELHACEIGSL